MIDAATTGMTPVGFKTYTSDVPLMPPNARPVMNPLTNVSATHSQSCLCDTLTSWLTFMDRIQSSSTTSSLLSMQPLPELKVKKPLHFREPRKEQRTQARWGPLWKYMSDDEVTMEDKRHTEEEELTLLEHHTPITLHDFLTNSGPMSCRATYHSMSGIMEEKSLPSTSLSK